MTKFNLSTDGRLIFYCSGCEYCHGVPVKSDRYSNWNWNGDLEKPTLTPSIFVNRGRECPELHACHSYLTDGKINYLSDCSHGLAGQIVEVEDLDEH